ncbi:MAG: hypothetical protein FWH37_02215 [Candidatus Bathyarchaeota archaeon]|nr:hypothetical protein [Candidatus Termiticorpusculum sp.]
MSSIDLLMLNIQKTCHKLIVNHSNTETVKGHFLDYFKEFDKVEAVQRLFGDNTTNILQELEVEFNWLNGYMHVDGKDGHIVICRTYLQKGNKTDIYLDLIHELCHVKQFREGKELFDKKYKYVDRPTEIDAYHYTIQEARRIGLTEDRICQYLKTEWINNAELERLATAIGVTFKQHTPKHPDKP